jgi:hypothetical protein
MTKMKIRRHMNAVDVLQFYGRYYFGIPDFMELSEKDGIVLKSGNFFTPIRKWIRFY